MISLEQVQLLETRVSKAIEYVQKVNAENAALVSEKSALQVKIDTYQKRIEELEVFVLRFKDEQGRIEDGIIAALDRLSQFEEAFETSLNESSQNTSGSAKAGKKSSAKPKEKPAPAPKPAEVVEPDSSGVKTEDANQEEVFFEIAEDEGGKDDDVSESELDIF